MFLFLPISGEGTIAPLVTPAMKYYKTYGDVVDELFTTRVFHSLLIGFGYIL